MKDYLPENIEVSREAQVALEAALEAGIAIRSKIGGKVELKQGMSNVVTEADKASGVAIRKVLGNHFPEDPILSEENTESNPRNPLSLSRLWIVDELDGSKNFSDLIDNVWISIAYAKLGIPVVGVAYNPILDRMYFAEQGKGSFYIGTDYGLARWVKKQIHVSGQTDLNKATVETSMSYDTDQTINHEIIKLALNFEGIFPRPRQIGSSVEQLCRVAAGISDLHFHSSLSPWDYAAAWVIVGEAGGVFKRMNGGKFNFMCLDSVVGNPILVNQLLVKLFAIRGNRRLIAKISERILDFKI